MSKRPFKLRSGNTPSVSKFMGVSPVKEDKKEKNNKKEEENKEEEQKNPHKNPDGTWKTVEQIEKEHFGEGEKETTEEDLQEEKKNKRKQKLKNIGRIALSALEGGLNEAYGTKIKATKIFDAAKSSEKYKTLQEKYAELEAKLKLKDDNEEDKSA